MKSTIRSFLFIALSGLFVISCGNGQQQNQPQTQQQEPDSAARAQAKADSIAKARADSLAEIKKQREKEKQEKKKQLTLKDITFNSNGTFSVQVEAWRSEWKAEEQVSKWKKRGFSNAYVVRHGNPDTGNIWFRVRLGRVSNMQMAEKLAKLIRTKYNEKTWITETKSEA